MYGTVVPNSSYGGRPDILNILFADGTKLLEEVCGTDHLKL